MKQKPELLAPCHDFATLRAAINAGADAVYFGVKKFNMRMNADNFSEDELSLIVSECHENGVKAYLTLNVVVYEDELSEVKELLIKARESGVDAVIVHDIATLKLARSIGLNVHVSTQANITNSVSVNAYADMGASRVILSRELNLKQVKSIVSKSRIGVEVFIHGSMCVSISGRCFFSQYLYGRSANRGECLQPCRQKWVVKNDSGEMIYDGERFLSSKDLCTINFIPEIISSGVESLKIEGRMKDANYVSTVTRVYREAIDNFDKKRVSEWLNRLNSVFNRGFSSGFYYNNPEEDLINSGNHSPLRKELIGEVVNYYKKVGVAELMVKKELMIGDEVIIESRYNFIKQKVKSMEVNHKQVNNAVGLVGLLVDKPVRKGMKVYKMVSNNDLMN